MDVKNYMLSLTPSPEPDSERCNIKNIGKRPRRTRLLWESFTVNSDALLQMISQP